MKPFAGLFGTAIDDLSAENPIERRSTDLRHLMNYSCLKMFVLQWDVVLEQYTLTTRKTTLIALRTCMYIYFFVNYPVNYCIFWPPRKFFLLLPDKFVPTPNILRPGQPPSGPNATPLLLISKYRTVIQ